MTAANNPTLGEFLRQERERRGITIEQVASASKISVKLLHALEGDHYAELPAKPFVRGFITSYSRFIGLDPKEVLTRFNDFIDHKAHDRPTREAGHSGYAFEKRDGEQSRMYLWIVMASFIVVGGVLILFLKPSLHHHRGSHLDKLREAHNEEVAAPTVLPQQSPGPSVSSAPLVVTATPRPSPSLIPSPMPKQVAKAPAVVEKVVPEVQPAPQAQPTPQAEPSTAANDPLNSGTDLQKKEIHYKIIFKAIATAWVRYQVDNKKVMKFPLKKDRILVLRARKEIRFQTSNSKSIDFSFNGLSYKNLDEDKNTLVRQGNATIFLPREVAGNIQEPFPGEPSLPGTPPPIPTEPVPDSSPTI